jgi:hypothetical protein
LFVVEEKEEDWKKIEEDIFIKKKKKAQLGLSSHP